MWFNLRTLDADYVSRAPNTFVMRREVDVPAEKLFAILADESEWTKWFPDMRAVRWLSAEGQRRQVHAVRQADTGSGDVVEHFVVWDAPRRMAFYAERMTTPLASEFFEDYVIEPLGGGRSRLVWTVAYQPRLPFRLFMFAIRPRFAKMFDDAADALVRHLAR